MGAVLDHLAAPEQPLDRGMHAEFRLEVLNLDLLPRQVFRRDDESEGDGRFVRVQESATTEAHRRLPGVHERGAFLLAEAESVLNRFRRKFDRFLDSDGDFSWLQIRFQPPFPPNRRRATPPKTNKSRATGSVGATANALNR